MDVIGQPHSPIKGKRSSYSQDKKRLSDTFCAYSYRE